jgi:hypothetical protein
MEYHLKQMPDRLQHLPEIPVWNKYLELIANSVIKFRLNEKNSFYYSLVRHADAISATAKY